MSNEMDKTRTPRSLTTREKKPLRWMPPEQLPEPIPQDGFVFRWVRVANGGQIDPTNLTKRMREGFEPVRAEDHPELSMHTVSADRFGGKFVGGVEQGGLLLCKIPKEFVEQRDEHYNGVTRQQIQSVDASLMRENDPRMPLSVERKTSVTFGTGK